MVVVEFYVLDLSVASIHCYAVDERDDALPPLTDLDVLRMGGRLHRSLRRSLAFSSASEQASMINLS